MKKKIQIDKISQDKIEQLKNIIKLKNTQPKNINFPYGIHWIFFNHNIPEKNLGVDGHPKRGSFFPLLKGYKRMFAGANLIFNNENKIDNFFKKESNISKVTKKKKSNNYLYFVEVNNTYKVGNKKLLMEKETIVFIKNNYKSNNSFNNKKIDPNWGLVFSGIMKYGNVSLFRYSALTYNSHRIHYDLKYTQKTEGHKNLLVHGPLIATTAMNELCNLTNRKIKSFNFSLIKPVYVNEKTQIKIFLYKKDNSKVLIQILKGKKTITFKAEAELY